MTTFCIFLLNYLAVFSIFKFWSIFYIFFILFSTYNRQKKKPQTGSSQNNIKYKISDPKNITNLNSLPDEVIEHISYNCQLIDTLALGCTCSTVMLAIRKVCIERKSIQYDTVIRHFPLHIIGSIPMLVWIQVEWINFNINWLSCTCYIDRIEHADIPGSPFKCCYDTHGRLVLILRRKTDVAVLFQRYTDNKNTWTFASKTLPIGGCRLSESIVARLALWLSNDYADF